MESLKKNRNSSKSIKIVFNSYSMVWSWFHRKGSNVKISDVIKNKLRTEVGEATIRQLNGGLITFYFVTANTFWSSGLGSIIGKGYDFCLFDLLTAESYRFPNRSIPKGNARNHKLGEEQCSMDTAVGILGYKYFHKVDGESVLEPMHVVSAILDWAGVAKNERGFITFF